MLLVYLSPFCVYVSQRNQKVPPPLRVFTKQHIRRWIARNLGFTSLSGPSGPKAIPIGFIGKLAAKRT